MIQLKKIISQGSIIILCLASLLALVVSSRQEGAVMDELAHIPAGYGYVRYLDYRLNPEHPPLLKALAALPLLTLDLSFPVTEKSWTTDVNGQWEAGTQFLYEKGNDPDTIVQMARFAPIILTLLLSLLIWRWGRKRLGKVWALVPAALFALSPTVLAHGHYVTTDIAAAFGVVIATYYFLRFLATTTNSNLWKSGVAFGVAQLLKFSMFLLVPYFIALAVAFIVVRAVNEKYQVGHFLWGAFWRKTGVIASSLLGIFVIGYAVIVYPVYTAFTWNYPQEKQVTDTTATLTSFAGGPTPAGASCKILRCPADMTILLSGNPVTRPFAQYLLGLLMVFQRAAGGNTAYFMGSVSAGGSHLYFPAVFALKETLPTLIIIAVALLYAAWSLVRGLRKPNRIAHAADFLNENFAEFAMFSFVFAYWANSIASPLNIGIRHLIPTMPFIYLLAAGAWKRWAARSVRLEERATPLQTMSAWAKTIISSSAKISVLVVLMGWFFVEVAVASPYYLSYYNEMAGGTANGYRFVTDSNYDWGQDILRLRDWVQNHPEVDRIAVEYFGGGKPSYYLGAKEVDWSSRKGNPASEGIHYFAISVGNLQNAMQPAAAGYARDAQDEYQWLLQGRTREAGMGGLPVPDWRVGTTIFVYKM